MRGRVGDIHRTLGTYVEALAGAGLLIDRLLEPPASAPIAERVPGYTEVPAVLVARCRTVALPT